MHQKSTCLLFATMAFLQACSKTGSSDENPTPSPTPGKSASPSKDSGEKKETDTTPTESTISESSQTGSSPEPTPAPTGTSSSSNVTFAIEGFSKVTLDFNTAASSSAYISVDACKSMAAGSLIKWSEFNRMLARPRFFALCPGPRANGKLPRALTIPILQPWEKKAYLGVAKFDVVKTVGTNAPEKFVVYSLIRAGIVGGYTTMVCKGTDNNVASSYYAAETRANPFPFGSISGESGFDTNFIELNSTSKINMGTALQANVDHCGLPVPGVGGIVLKSVDPMKAEITLKTGQKYEVDLNEMTEAAFKDQWAPRADSASGFSAVTPSQSSVIENSSTEDCEKAPYDTQEGVVTGRLKNYISMCLGVGTGIDLITYSSTGPTIDARFAMVKGTVGTTDARIAVSVLDKKKLRCASKFEEGVAYFGEGKDLSNGLCIVHGILFRLLDNAGVPSVRAEFKDGTQLDVGLKQLTLPTN